MRTWNPAADIALPLRTVEPTEWVVVGLFAGADAEIAPHFAVMAASPRHRFRALTDQLDRAGEWFVRFDERVSAVRHSPMRTVAHLLSSAYGRMRVTGRLPYPHNEQLHALRHARFPLPTLMLGTTVRTQADADRLLPMLAELPAAFRFVRVEPSEMVDLSRWLSADCDDCAPDDCGTCGGWGARTVLDLVEIAGGPGPEQLRTVQAIGGQVLAAQNVGRMEMLHDGPIWRDELVSGPALAIVANDPDSTVHGSHPYVEIAEHRQRWNQQPVGWRP